MRAALLAGRLHSTRDRALVTLAALLAAMGLRVALTPWLGDSVPVAFAVPAVAVVAWLCGVVWATALAALVVGWISIRWLPPNWPGDATATIALSVGMLFAAGAAGVLLAVRPAAAPHTAAEARWLASSARTAREHLRVAMLIALTLPFALLVAVGWVGQRTAMIRATEQAEVVGVLAAEQASRVIQANTIVSRQVAARLARFEFTGAPQNRETLHRDLASLAEGLPHINSIWVLGADGYPVASSLFAEVPRINYADREYFQFHQANRKQLFVSQLLRTRTTNELFYDLSARWEDEAGRFRGVINVTLRPEYVQDFLRKLTEQTPALGVALLRTDGHVLARWPEPPDVGDRLADDHPALARIRAADAGETARVEGSGAYEGRSFAVRTLDPWPLAVSVSIDRRKVREQWAGNIAGISAVILAATVALLAALGSALRRTESELAALDRLVVEAEQRARVESTLRQTQKLEALGKLTGGVAHDFNNLLAVVQNNVHVLVFRDPALAASPAVAGIRRALENGQMLTRKLMSFARRQPLRPQTLDLAAVLPQIVELMQVSVGTAAVPVGNVAADTPRVRVDRAEFELALLNLAMNARGAGARRIEVAAREAPPAEWPTELGGGDVSRFVAVAVRDDGTGMSDEVRSRAFEPFFTTKPEGEGTGLGLSQVYGFCVQAGGTAQIASAIGSGTTVTLFLPASDALPQHEGTAPPTAAAPLDATVLVVEDNSEVAHACCAVLDLLGARSVVARDASEALATIAARATPIDIVLSDVALPGGMSGLDLAERLRAARPELPVVLITGFAAELDRALAAGFTVLPKPIEPDALARALVQAMGSAPRRTADPLAS